MPSVDHDAAPAACTNDFNAGDIGYVPQTLGHYIENGIMAGSAGKRAFER